MLARMRTLFALLLCAAIAACTHQPKATTAPAVPVASIDLAKQRAISLQRIRDYLAAAVYPLDEQGRPTSIFRDAEGRLCAMAYLIDASGRRDLVDEVVRTNNKLKLADVKDGPLMDWMLGSGLTQEEIAMVQGVLAIDYDTFERPNNTINNFNNNNGVAPENRQILITKGRNEIKRRLAVAEQQLVANTNSSLEIAANRARKPIRNGNASVANAR
jgi:hypothetical protein